MTVVERGLLEPEPLMVPPHKAVTSASKWSSADSSLTFFAAVSDSIRLWENNRVKRLFRAGLERRRFACRRAVPRHAR